MPWPPAEPPPSRYRLPDPNLAGPDDVVAVGGDLMPGTLLQAYRGGMFPMYLPDGPLAWWSPQERGILPVDGMNVSRSLRRSARRYTTTVDADCAAVIDGCADPSRPDGWIRPDIRESYLELHDLGWVHSIETWSASGDLVGGLYGVSIGGLFAGESMFYRSPDASKVALLALVERMAAIPNAVVDVQWVTPHLESLGAVAVSRPDYLRMLHRALRTPVADNPWN